MGLEDRTRFASFVATTNNRHPLKDATGSRRYICILIPDGQMIDNTGDIDYGQLYAQVMYELLEQKAPYWFNNDEVARIQQLNQDFMEKTSSRPSSRMTSCKSSPTLVVPRASISTITKQIGISNNKNHPL